ncbi:MAG: T9SS type A sorting domain-containing protein [Bacteroidetes bacterium]|nr:T9SS type A sorting domain-containing protein [Bacteroidota bacterium]
MRVLLLFGLLLFAGNSLLSGQNYTEILGRPTNSSVTMSILFDQQADVYWEYGIASGDYTVVTDTLVAAVNVPLEADFTNLITNNKYYYRTRYRATGSSTTFLAGEEHTFHTQRAVGSTFTFAVETDPHLDSNSNPPAFTLTLQNILSMTPDFLIDLGDNFMSEKLPVINQTEITNRHLLYRPYFGSVCHSVPLFLVIGNHEGENGWQSDGTANCLTVMASNTRKLYYPNPLPNNFYSGDTIAENFVGLRENYYAWQWGNALFIVLDPYWYTTAKPEWGWTLGEDQYNWFKKVITSGNAKFKFVFCHQLVGGNGNDGRGGTEFADFFEMGGKNVDSTWGFTVNRPGWADPEHTLMVENHATIFFHGHDHCYAKQDKDGIVYQEVPQPSSKNITTITGLQYGYVNGILMPSRGYLLVKVTDSTVKVDYVKTFLPTEENATQKNGDVAYSYTIQPFPAGIEERSEKQASFQLGQNFPNPFDKTTTINYTITLANKVQIKIYNIFGRESATLVNQYQKSGKYNVSVNSDNLSLISGIYYCRMTVGNDAKTMKMICSH